MAKPTVVLADGTEFEGEIGLVDRRIRIGMSYENAQAHLLDFMDPAKTAVITQKRGAFWDIYRNYTQFERLMPTLDGGAGIWLHVDGEPQNELNKTNIPKEYLPEEYK